MPLADNLMMNTYKRHRFPSDIIGMAFGSNSSHQSIDGRPLRNPLRIRGQICCVLWKKYGVLGGYQKFPVITGEPDVLGAGDVVEALG
jgi:hypothetical protein